MAISKSQSYDTAHSASEPKRAKVTSITGHTVQMATITMSFGDMEDLANMLARIMQENGFHGHDESIAREFVETFELLR